MFKQQVNKNIIKTLSYSDVFDFPLTKKEIYKYYIGEKIAESDFNSSMNDLIEAGFISKKSSYYFLNGKYKNYTLRTKRKKESRRKMMIAKKVASVLSFLPTIKLIGVSGSLSMNNCDRKDDIDLFFITSSNTLWLSRLVVNIALLVMGIKRSRLDSYGIDRICPNMFLSEDNLKIDSNLFTAHEIAQLKVLVNKDGVYQNFLSTNKWVLKTLPHSINVENRLVNRSENKYLKVLDRFFYTIQSIYMRKNKTIEKVSVNRAAFHPKDKTSFVLDLYKKRYKNYKNTLFFVNFDQARNAPELASKFTPGY